MKRLLIIVIACIAAPIASAELYKYVDKDGKTVYSDQPPVNIDSKQMNIPSGTSTNTPAPASAPKTALERDRELQKTRDEARDRAKKSDPAPRHRVHVISDPFLDLGERCIDHLLGLLDIVAADEVHRGNDQPGRRQRQLDQRVSGHDRADR